MAKKNNKKLLIVEDDEDFLNILKIKFTSEGFFVVTANNGQDAINLADEEKPDLIMSDILMPKMDGLEMAKKIRAADKNVPIVFLTNITDANYTDEIKKLGTFDYLLKSQLTINDIFVKVKAKLGLL